MGDEGGRGDDGLSYPCLSPSISGILSQSLVKYGMVCGDEGGKGDDGLSYPCLSPSISWILSQSLVKEGMVSASRCNPPSVTFSSEIGLGLSSPHKLSCLSGSTENPSPVTVDGAGSEFILVEFTKTGVGSLDVIPTELRACANGVDFKGIG